MTILISKKERMGIVVELEDATTVSVLRFLPSVSLKYSRSILFIYIYICIYINKMYIYTHT